MCTTTHLSDHVQDHMTSRLHQPQRVGALLWCHPLHQGTSVGPGQYPRYTDARKGRPRVAQRHHKTETLTRRRNKFVEHLHGSGAGSLRPRIYEATTELGDKNTFRHQPRVTRSPAGDPARDSALELREAPRQNVQSDHLHLKQVSQR